MTDKKEKVAEINTPADILDDLKRIEKIRKAQLLSTALAELKSKAKEILILKKETTLLLKEIGLCETDRKKVIDYINSSVKLTPSDISKARSASRREKESCEEEVDKKIKNIPISTLTVGGGGGAGCGTSNFWVNGINGGYSGGSTTGLNNSISYCSASNTSGDLDVSIGGMKLKM